MSKTQQKKIRRDLEEFLNKYGKEATLSTLAVMVREEQINYELSTRNQKDLSEEARKLVVHCLETCADQCEHAAMAYYASLK